LKLSLDNRIVKYYIGFRTLGFWV